MRIDGSSSTALYSYQGGVWTTLLTQGTWKDSVRLASTGNLTLSGLSAIDGVTPASGERILVKNQTTASQNGIYLASSGSWTRASDADASAEVVSGMTVYVSEGQVNAEKFFVLTTVNPITLGTTSLTFMDLQTSLAYAWKQPVRAATTANITLSGTQTVDGVALATLDRVLVKNQTTASQNGIYLVQSGAWTRTNDASNTTRMISGTTVYVSEGTTNGTKFFYLSTVNPITVGTTSLSFSQIGSAPATETRAVTAVATNYTILPTDHTIAVTTSGAFTITLPASPATGQFFVIKDVSGSAGTNNITVSGNGNNIDGAATSTISTNYGRLRVQYTGSRWSIF
jgi:phage-related tail fiber protein